ncbi:MAG: DegT/DnrJ/EryC1/StrS family aminotransferase [Candidatus Woesearchaeota archaeon]
MERCIDILKNYTGHGTVRLTNSGNLAIFAALYIGKIAGYKSVVVPDQGGWLTYYDYPKIIGLSLEEVKTNRGIILAQELDKHKNKILLVSSLAGYFAEQPMEEIAETCRKNSLFLIEDATSALSNQRLALGLADVAVGSFGKAKVVNNGHGGFISLKNRNLWAVELNSLIKPVNLDYNQLFKKLAAAHERLDGLYSIHDRIVLDLKKQGFTLVHGDKKGINVVIKYKNEEERTKIIKYCSENRLEYTFCPRQIRVLEQAVCIEVKRLP